MSTNKMLEKLIEIGYLEFKKGELREKKDV